MSDLYYYAMEQQLEDGTWTRVGVSGKHPRRFEDGIAWDGQEVILRAREAVGVKLDRTTLQAHGNVLQPDTRTEVLDAIVAEVAMVVARPTRVVEMVELCTDQERKMHRPDAFWTNAKAMVLEALSAEAVVAAMTGQAVKPVANDATGYHLLRASARVDSEKLRAGAREALAEAKPLPATDERRFECLLVRDHVDEGHADEIIVARWEADAILAWAQGISGWDPVRPQLWIREQLA